MTTSVHSWGSRAVGNKLQQLIFESEGLQQRIRLNSKSCKAALVESKNEKVVEMSRIAPLELKILSLYHRVVQEISTY